MNRSWAAVLLRILVTPVVIFGLGFGHGAAVLGAAYFVLSNPREIRREPGVLLFPFFVAGLLAPAHAGYLLVRSLWLPDAPLNVPFSFLGLPVSLGYSVLAALCGGALGLWAIGWQGIWKRHQGLQALNLPTSTVRGAALGQVELKGVARRLDGAPGGPVLSFTTGTTANGFRQHVEPFYLEDATGRILVDPRGVTVRGGVTSNLEARLFEALLTRGALNPGDPVYVIGRVQRRDDAPPGAVGPEALVLKPLEEPAAGFLPRMLRRGLGLFRRDFQHVFFLTDTSEEEARRLGLRGARRAWMLGLIYLGAAAGVLHQEGPRFFQGPARWSAMEIYVSLRGRDRLEGLKARLTDPDPAVRASAMSFLDYAARDEKSEVIDAEILRALADPSADVRDEAFEALQKVGLRGSAADVSRALSELLTSDVPRLRLYALELLPRMRQSPENGTALGALLDDPDVGVRKAAVEALTAYPLLVQQALPSLLVRLNDPAEGWAVERALRWTEYDPAFAVDEYLKRRRDASPKVRSLALQVLGRYKSADPAVVPALREGLADPDPWVRWRAQDALALNSPAGAYDADRIPVLTALLSEPDLELLQAAVRDMGAIGPPAAVAVPSLIRLLRDPQVIAGGSSGKLDAGDVLSALGRIGDPSAEEAVLAFLSHEQPTLRTAAAETLSRVRPASSAGREARVRALDQERVHATQEAMARALLREGSPESIAALGEWLAAGKGFFHIRLAVARSLGELGRAAAPALPGLERMAERETRDVAEVATEALRRIRDASR